MRVFDSYLLIKGLFVWNRYSTAESHRATEARPVPYCDRTPVRIRLSLKSDPENKRAAAALSSPMARLPSETGLQ